MKLKSGSMDLLLWQLWKWMLKLELPIQAIVLCFSFWLHTLVYAAQHGIQQDVAYE